jgi:amino acid transporter
MRRSAQMSTPPSAVSTALAKGRLGVAAVVFFVVAAAAPLTVVAGGATTGFAVTGSLGIPISYLAVAAILALFAVGYVAMSRYVVNAGAFYTYIARGLGRVLGVGAAFVAVYAYLAMSVGLLGGLGVVAAGYLATFGITVSWWVCALVALVVVGVLGLARVDINGKVLAILLVSEIAVAVIYDLVMVSHPDGGGVSFATLGLSHLWGPGIGAALVTAITGYVGFEATVVFSEESKDPQRTIARATYISVAITGVLYGVSAWAMSVATGPDHIVGAAKAEGTELIFTLVSPHLWPILVHVGHLLFTTSLFAAVLSFHSTVTRYCFALGRERVLPAALGRTNPRNGAPRLASVVQSIIAFVVIVGYAISGVDPLVYLFFWISVTGGLGVLILMLFTSAAVIGYFAVNPNRETTWRRVVAPALAFTGLGAVLVVTLLQFNVLLNVAADSPWRWVFPASFLAAGAAGVVWALILRASRPSVYLAIGLGAHTATPGAGTPTGAGTYVSA